MNEKAVSLLRCVIARPGMYVTPDELKVVVAFISGMDCMLSDGPPEDNPLAGFHQWVVDRYFQEPQAIAWEGLIGRIPECAQLSEDERVSFFLKMIGDFLDETVGEQ